MKVEIHNYQSIEKVAIEPKGFTIIVGDSNVGKSALVRALVGAMANTLEAPSIRNGKTGAFVSIEKDGHTILVERTPDTTSYVVDGQKFTKLARKSCPAVEQLGFKAIKVGETELTPQWVVDQFDPLFILDEPASVAAGIITQASRLDVVSKASKAGSSELRSKKILMKTREQDKEIAERRLGLYKKVPEFLVALKESKAKLEELKIEERTLLKLKEVKQELIKSRGISSVLNKVSEFKVPELPVDLTASIQSRKRIVGELAVVRKYQIVFKDLLAQKLYDWVILEKVLLIWQKVVDLAIKYKEIQEERQFMVKNKEELGELARNIDKDERILREEIKECPLCGSGLLNHVICDV